MAQSKFIKVNEGIAKKVVDTFGKIEAAVVNSYAKVEDAVVGGYIKVEDAFVDRCLTRDGETVEEAKGRLKQGQEQRERGKTTQ